MREGLRALRYRNYRLFFFGQAISLIGTWLQNVGLSWLVYRLTGSAVLLGAVQFAMLTPSLVISPFAGAWVDRVDRMKLLKATQWSFMVLAGVLAALVVTDRIEIWHILTLSTLLGIVAAFDAPARQTLVAEIIEDRADLPNAIALNSFLFNFARLIGPVIAGVIVAAVGEGPCFALNAASYAPVLLAIQLMSVRPFVKPGTSRRIVEDIQEAYRYVSGYLPIRSILSMLALVSLLGGTYSVLVPVYAADVYRGGPGTLGVMYSAVGLGALIAGLVLAARRSVFGLGNFLVVAGATFSVGLLLFAPFDQLWVGLPALALIGFGAMAHMTASNTLVQTLVEDSMRGRVMAFFTMAFLGAMPFGSFASGVLADLVEPHWVLVGAGVIGLAATMMFRRVLPLAREIGRSTLAERGIVPPEPMPGDVSTRAAANPADPAHKIELR